MCTKGFNSACLPPATACSLPGGRNLGWLGPPPAMPEPSLGKPGISIRWPSWLDQLSGSGAVGVGFWWRGLEEGWRRLDVKCWDAAQPPSSPPSPPHTLLLTAPGCRLSCSPIGCQPPPSDQWESCWSELRGEAQQRQGPARCYSTQLCSTLNVVHLEATLCQSQNSLILKKSRIAARGLLLGRSISKAAGYRLEGQIEAGRQAKPGSRPAKPGFQV